MTQPAISLQLNSDLDLIHGTAPTERVLEITIQAPASRSEKNRPGLNLALVIDRSGSMSGSKLAYVKQAAYHVVDLLREQDRAALVAFDSQVDVSAASAAVTPENRERLRRRISRLEAGSTTYLSGGWLAGCDQVADASQEDSLNRVLLLTDGLANEGITDPEVLAGHARELFVRGISTTTFGVGSGFNEHLLEAMSNQGGGNFYYIETPTEIPGLFAQEFKELLSVTARDVEVVLDLPSQTSARVYGEWPVECPEGQVRISLGSLSAGRQVAIYAKLSFPPAGDRETLAVRASVRGKGEAGELYENSTELVFRAADGREIQAAEPKREVRERFSEVDLAEAANQALKLERRGERIAAAAMVQGALDAQKEFINPMQAGDYARMAGRMKDGMDEIDRKRSHQMAYRNRRRLDQMGEYDLEVISGHLMADINGVRVMLGTGVPTSVGRRDEWYFMGRPFPIAPNYSGTGPEDISRMVGERIDILLGADVLRHFFCKIDTRARKVIFSRGPVAMRGYHIPLQDSSGIPVARGKVSGQSISLCLDSGVIASYLPAELVAGHPHVGIIRDFSPGMGSFEARLHEVSIQFHSRSAAKAYAALKCGILPSLLGRRLSQHGIQGVLGTELYEKYAVEFASPNGELILERYVP